MTVPPPVILRSGKLSEVVGGQLMVGHRDVEVRSVVIDSRRVGSGDLFVAIRGQRFDGHQFIREAVSKGAAGLIVSDKSILQFQDTAVAEEEKPFVIVVPDSVRALQLMGRFVRRASGTRVVAITGSVGKTTTKELMASVLTDGFDVSRTKGNLNNHIGLPLSLLELRRRPEIAVVELGMNHAGEIRTLVEIAEPEIRVWTNVAEVHSQFFSSVEAIADAKAEILEGATEKDHLIVNAGDPRVMSRIKDFPGEVTTFGVDVPANIQATGLRFLGLDGMEAQVETVEGTQILRTSLLGEGSVANVLAAIAVALQFQLPLETVLARVKRFEAQPHRGQVVRLGNITVIDDSYNSSPLALERVLFAVGQSRVSGRRIAVLGEMLELGERSEALHRYCGRLVVSGGFDVLLVVGGTPIQALADAAIAAGLPSASVLRCGTSTEAADRIGGLIQSGDVVLVKGSRGIGTHRIVDRLTLEFG
jgi:UDP-N-acetylmuramoyl-tripeptide--D-alanyl-D-alanine ligase